jgi:hypothetical protein
MKRRLSSLALLFTLLDPPALVAAAVKTPHQCSDHVCACARRARQAARPCHGSAHDAPGMQAACSHDPEPVLLRSTIPATLALAPSAVAFFAREELRPSARGEQRPGFTRIDSPPPRSL